MQSESPGNGKERQAVSAHSQEIEYALILHRMINAIRDDPDQMRMTVYEFARARLRIDTSAIEESERERLSTALETAIQGVEQFLLRREDRLLPPASTPTSTAVSPASSRTSPIVATHRTVTPEAADILTPGGGHSRLEPAFSWDLQRRPPASRLSRLLIGLLLLGALGGLVYFKQSIPLLRDGLAQWISPNTTQPTATPSVAQSALVSPKPAIATAPEPSFPTPSDYGVYALENDVLSELYALPERVPDKRIAVSTPVELPSRTTLPEGKARFIVFRRDLAGNAPDRIDIRVVARVARAISFDTKGRPNIASIPDVWNMRNVSYEFRVRPISGNPEMLLVQSDKPDFSLPAGRYVLVLKDQGFDFTVAGKVTDPAQCLERTDAANGSFYSECLKP